MPSINTSTVINAGAAITKGVELEVAATPVDGLQLSGSMGHRRSDTIRSFDNPFGPGTTGVGKHLVFAPRWVASGSVAYTLPVDLPGKVTLGGQVQYTSRTYVDVVNTPNADAPPQTFVNANIGYALPGGHWKLKLWVEPVRCRLPAIHLLAAGRQRLLLQPAPHGDGAGQLDS